jgi:hypothetical protein
MRRGVRAGNRAEITCTSLNETRGNPCAGAAPCWGHSCCHVVSRIGACAERRHVLANVGPASLTLDGRKGVFGVVYMRAIAAAAGCGFSETSPGEDVLAVDCSIVFPQNVVRVQVKTTHTHAIDGTNPRLSYTASQHWVDSWSAAQVPVYFVVVVAPDDSDLWLNHHAAGTDLFRTAAYWSRIAPGEFSPGSMGVSALRSQRIDATTLGIWQQQLISDYGPRGTP